MQQFKLYFMAKNSRTIYFGKVSVGNITFTHILSKNPTGRIEVGANIPVIPFQRRRIILEREAFSKQPSSIIRISSKRKS